MSSLQMRPSNNAAVEFGAYLVPEIIWYAQITACCIDVFAASVLFFLSISLCRYRKATGSLRRLFTCIFPIAIVLHLGANKALLSSFPPRSIAPDTFQWVELVIGTLGGIPFLSFEVLFYCLMFVWFYWPNPRKQLHERRK